MAKAEKRYPACPGCGGVMSSHALLCRDCYKEAGANYAAIYEAARQRGEASPRSSPQPEGTPKRIYTINPSQKR